MSYKRKYQQTVTPRIYVYRGGKSQDMNANHPTTHVHIILRFWDMNYIHSTCDMQMGAQSLKQKHIIKRTCIGNRKIITMCPKNTTRDELFNKQKFCVLLLPYL